MSFTGVAPLLMSVVLALMLLIEGDSGIPIHDEDAWDHVGMLLIFGQVPIVAWFLVAHRLGIKPALPVLALQLTLLVGLSAVVRHQGQRNHDFVARRIMDDRPIAGSEGALLRAITGEQQGKPDYAAMDLIVDQYVRSNLAVVQKELVSLGALQSLNFRGVNGIGWDRYDARFANGAMEWSIYMTPNGPIHGLAQVDDKNGCRSSEVYGCRTSETGAWPSH